MPATASPPATRLDPAALRADFPVLGRKVGRHRLVYLDSAATSQKPRAVIDRLTAFYSGEYAKINETHTLSKRATAEFEGVRAKVARFINAPDAKEVVFLRGASEALSLLGDAFADGLLRKRDEVLITAMEHHSNILPWEIACRKSGAVLRAAPVAPDGSLDMAAFEKLLTKRTKVVAVTHVSNVLGTVNPVRRICAMARDRGAAAVVDAAQSAPHLPLDVRDIGCDFLAASGHKMGGPTGVGFLYGRYEWLERLQPQEGGSEAAKTVTLDRPPEFKPPPHRHEDGTPAVAEVTSLGAALDYLSAIGMDRIAAYVTELMEYATAKLSAVPGVRLIGTAPGKTAILSFNVGRIKPEDVIQALDAKGIAVGGPELAAQPLMRALGEEAGAARASFSFYNTRADADALARAVAAIAGR